MSTIERHKAAIHRTAFSRPLRLAMEHNILAQDHTVLDYGCGYGDDVRLLQADGFSASGWDPHFRAEADRKAADLVNLGYVLNVIERPAERLSTLKAAWALCGHALIVSAMVTVQARGVAVPFGDGVVTSRGTFQKYYEQKELEDLLREQLGVEPVALGMGVFAVIRDATQRSELLARQFRRSHRHPSWETATAVFEDNAKHLEPLLAFLSERGRWPTKEERTAFGEVVERFGGLGRAISLLTKVVSKSEFEKINQRARDDLLVYLALTRFGTKPRMSDLDITIQRDIKALFGSFRDTEKQADLLLYSLGDFSKMRASAKQAACGKLLPDSIYVHESAVDELPARLRMYEGCARRYVGDRAGANIVKLNLTKPAVNYLLYPDFDKDPHPALSTSMEIDLTRFKVHLRDFSQRPNPPILHRKELFIAEGHSNHAKFSKLTRQEEKAGLYEAGTNSIGTRMGWNERLEACGVSIKGHRVVKA